MRSLRPGESRAVLIGVADYPDGGDFASVEAALHNVLRLKGLLTDPAYAGFHGTREYTRSLVNPQTGEGVRAAVKRAAEQATDVLFVYYVGHGSRVGAERELYLTSCTTAGAESVVTTGLRYTVLRDLLRAARARVVVLVLDCCFSGVAAKVLGDDEAVAEELAEEELLDRAALKEDVDEGLLDGVCVLASSGPTQTSGAEGGLGAGDLTTFTAHFVASLESREDNDREPLILSTLFRRTERRMRRADVPQKPVMAIVGTADRLIMRQAVVVPAPAPVEEVAADPAPVPGADARPAGDARRLLTWRTPAGDLDVFDPALAERIIALHRGAFDDQWKGGDDGQG